MKKQLGILAGSVLLASSAQAMIVTDNVVVVFNTAGSGSFIVDTGVAAADLANGTGFTLDASAASAALGGTIESYGVFGSLSGTGVVYNYDSLGYLDAGAGAVYASSTGGGGTLSQIVTGQQTAGVALYLSNSVFGFNAEGSGGDADGSAQVTLGLGGLLVGAGDVAQIFTQTQDETGVTSSPDAVTIVAPEGSIEGVSLVGDTLSVTALQTNEIPVPAAAWLFGSALIGLGVVRRKK